MLEISFVFDCCGAYYDAAETLDSTDEKEILASDRSESISSNHRDSLDDVKRSLSMSHNRYRFMPIESSPFTFSEHACEAMNGPTPAAPVFTLPKLAGPNREAPPPDRQSPLLQSSLRLGHYWLRKVGGGQFVQCMDPKLVALEFYGDHDTTLGRFLHRVRRIGREPAPNSIHPYVPLLSADLLRHIARLLGALLPQEHEGALVVHHPWRRKDYSRDRETSSTALEGRRVSKPFGRRANFDLAVVQTMSQTVIEGRLHLRDSGDVFKLTKNLQNVASLGVVVSHPQLVARQDAGALLLRRSCALASSIVLASA